MGTLQRVLLLACIPVGAWGTARFMRPLGSPRARTIAVVCYLGLPLPYGALGTGRWDGLVAYAAFPFIAWRLARAAKVEPFGTEPGPRWRSRPAGQVGVLGAIVATAASFAPAIVPIVAAHGARLDRRRGGGGRRATPAGGSSWWRSSRSPWRCSSPSHGWSARCWPGGRPSPSSASPWPERPLRDGANWCASPSGRWPARPSRGCSSLAAALPLVIGRGDPARVGGAAVGGGTRLVGPRARGGPRGHGVLRAVADRRVDARGARRRCRHRPRHLVLRERPDRTRVRVAPAGGRGGPRVRGRRVAPRRGRRRRRPLGPPVAGCGAAARVHGQADARRDAGLVARRPAGAAGRRVGDASRGWPMP